MKKIFAVAVAMAFIIVWAVSYAGQNIIKEGLLGAGAGAIGGAVSGADGDDLWKGALAGAGVNIVGGALLDSITGEEVDSVDHVRRLTPEDAYSRGYNEGFNNGFKQGYTQGFKEGVKESVR